MQENKRKLGTLALIACILGISASATLNKLAMAAGLHPIWLSVLRLGVTVAALLPFFLRRPDMLAEARSLPRRQKGLTVLSGIMLAIHFGTWAAALAHADAVIVTAIWSTFSLMTVVGSSLLLHERTPLPAILGIFLALAGVAICAVGASGSQLLGVVLALLAAISQAGYTLCGRVVRRRLDTTPYTMVVYTVAFVGLLLCALVLRLPLTGMNAQGIGASVALALICTLGGHSMQNYALKYYKAPTVSAVLLTEVFTGPLLVFLFLGEAPQPRSVIGGAVILLGVGWYMFYEWRHTHGALQGDGKPAEYSEV